MTQAAPQPDDSAAAFPERFAPVRFSACQKQVAGQVLLLGALVAVSFFNYLLFHSLAELYSIIIACGTFMIAWSARRHYHNNYLLFIGTAYLFIAFFDTLHTLGYHGMSVFKDFPGYNLGPQLWLVGRAMEACTLVVAPWFIQRPLHRWWVVTVYLACSGAALWAIFAARSFPVCFTPESGLTDFKIISEYVIVALLLLALGVLTRQRKELDRQIFRLLFASIFLTIASELCFTLYISHYGPSNLLGHVFKIIAYTLIYFAIIETTINHPFALLFRDVRQRQDAMLAAQRTAKLGSWSWPIGAPRMIWTEGVYLQLDLDEQLVPPTMETMLAALHADDCAALQQAFQRAAQEQQPFAVEVRRAPVAGEIRYLRVEGAYEQGEDEGPALAGIVQDVTERVAAEKMRDDIDGITRHDLRSPLTPIIGYPEILLERGGLTKPQVEMIQDIRSCGLKMLKMINNSLTLYKIERGTYQLNPEYFDLTAELRELLNEVAGRDNSRQVHCELRKEGKVLGEAESFQIFGEKLLCYTLFANLLNNAIEASPPRGVVTIDMQQTGAAWLIALHNDGEVPREIQKRFFEKYVTHGKQYGTGLGTYSALMVAEAHGGTIRFVTSAATGTTLTVEFPKPATV